MHTYLCSLPKLVLLSQNLTLWLTRAGFMWLLSHPRSVEKMDNSIGRYNWLDDTLCVITLCHPGVEWTIYNWPDDTQTVGVSNQQWMLCLLELNCSLDWVACNLTARLLGFWTQVNLSWVPIPSSVNLAFCTCARRMSHAARYQALDLDGFVSDQIWICRAKHVY